MSDTKFNPDNTNYARDFGEPVLQATLNTNDAVQEFTPDVLQSGRYVAIVFRNSFNSTGFIDLWEFEAFGYVEPKD